MLEGDGVERQTLSYGLPAPCLSTLAPSEPVRTPARPLEKFVSVTPWGHGTGETVFFCISRFLQELYFVLYDVCMRDVCMCGHVCTRMPLCLYPRVFAHRECARVYACLHVYVCISTAGGAR